MQLPRIIRQWTPASFLFVGGSILTVIGSSGAMGVLGRVSAASLFHPPPWINWLHLSVGLVVILTALAGGRRLQRNITFFPAIVGTTIGVVGLMLGPYAAPRQDWSDHLTHLSAGAGALLALWNSRRHAPVVY